jgi:competence protein ComEC
VKFAILFATGITAARISGNTDIFFPAIVLGLFILIVLLVRFPGPPKQIISLTLTSLIIFQCGFIYYSVNEYRTKEFHDFYLENLDVRGEVESVSPGSDYKRIILQNVIISRDSTLFHPEGKLLAYAYNPEIVKELNPGDTLIYKGSIQSIEEISNPGEYSLKEQYYARDIYARTSLSEKSNIKILESKALSFQKVIHYIRLTGSEIVDSLSVSSVTKGIIKALTLGERSDIDDEVYSDFVTGGIIHILAVSGLHVGYILILLLAVLGRFGLKKRILLSIPVLVIFIFVSGGNAPVIRAVTMAVIFMIAVLFGRDSDGFNSMSLAFIILLIYEPYQLFEAGFQLSFSAVAGILLVLRLLEPYYEKYLISGVRRKFISAIAVTIAAQVATIPVLLYHWGYFSPTGLVNNFFAIPLAGLILFSTILLFLFYPLSGMVSNIFAASADSFTNILVTLTSFSNEFIGKSVSLQPSVWWLISYYIAAFIFCWIIFGKRSILRKTLFSSGLIAAIVYISPIIASNPLDTNKLKMVMLDIGQGDAVLFITPNKKTILIDAGNYKYPDSGVRYIFPFLRRNGIDKIDLAFISHLDSDHAGGSVSLIRNRLIDKVMLPGKINTRKYSAYYKFLEDNNVLIEEYSAKKIEFDNVGIYILRDYLQDSSLPVTENDRSGVLKIVYGDISFLFTGDAGFLVEERFIKKYSDFLDSDVLKVSHHGSKYGTSKEFLAEVTPEYALISSGRRNRYGHPAERVLGDLKAANTKVLRTDISGCIILSTDGKEITNVDWRNW